MGEHVAHGIHVGTLLGQAAGTQVGLLRNVYVFRHDWHQGRIVRAEEYANPVTFTRTFGVTRR